ncbi:NUDIX hydrolase [Micromonospora sp. M12]
MSALTWAVAAVVSDDTGRVLLCQQGRGARRYALPGGRLRPTESPVRAALRDIRAETGWDIELIDLVGVYHLTRPTGKTPAGRAGPLPDVLVHVFRARAADGSPTADPPPGCRLSWHSRTRCPRRSPAHPGCRHRRDRRPLRRAPRGRRHARHGRLRATAGCHPAPLPSARPVEEGRPGLGMTGSGRGRAATGAARRGRRPVAAP